MYNWSVDEKTFKKNSLEEYEIWKIQQMVNYGLGHDKLDENKVRKYWSRLFIDSPTRRYLEFLLWPKGRKF